MTFLKNIAKNVLKTNTVDEAGCIGDIAGWIDTGSYVFNALLSASLYKGIPTNKITGLSGVSGVGKTYYALQGVKNFLKQHEENQVLYYDSEAAITEDMLIDRGIDTSRIVVYGIDTIETFRTSCTQAIKEYAKSQKDTSTPRLLIVLDSMGQLSSRKELEDIEKGDDKVDMTKAKLLKGAFRSLTILSARHNVPILLTNHVYSAMTQYAGNVQAGGSGMVYAASSIVEFSKGREKVGTEIVGAIIRAKLAKSRLSKEQQFVYTLLNFETGLNKWFGMDEFAIASGAWVKEGNMIRVTDPNDGVSKKKFAKALMREPEKWFTEEVMETIEKWVNSRFAYGSIIDHDDQFSEDETEGDKEDG